MLAISNKCKLKQIKVRLAISNKISKNQRKRGMEKMAIKIALAGNPNCGKTTLFNALPRHNK